MTEAQAQTVKRLCSAWQLESVRIILKPGLLWSLPEGYIVLVQHFIDGHEVEYGISTLGQASS